MFQNVNTANFIIKCRELQELTKTEIKAAFDELHAVEENLKLFYVFGNSKFIGFLDDATPIDEIEEYYTNILSMSVELYRDVYVETDIEVYVKCILMDYCRNDFEKIKVFSKRIIELCRDSEVGSGNWLVSMNAKYRLISAYINDVSHHKDLKLLVEDVKPLRDIYEECIKKIYG